MLILLTVWVEELKKGGITGKPIFQSWQTGSTIEMIYGFFDCFVFSLMW